MKSKLILIIIFVLFAFSISATADDREQVVQFTKPEEVECHQSGWHA